MSKIIDPNAKKEKGKKAHRGMQDQSEAVGASPDPSSSSMPFDVLSSSSPSSSKRKVPSFDVSSQSSSSNKRGKQSQGALAISQFAGVISDLNSTIRLYQPPPAPATAPGPGLGPIPAAIPAFAPPPPPPPDPAPAPAPAPATGAGQRSEAIRRFLSSVQGSWLTDEEAATMVHIFQKDESAVEAYMAIDIDNVNIRRLWVLQSVRAASGFT